MPRVSEEYIQRRRRAILVAAWRCFARDGFHATSMDDVSAAAGVSPSVMYRWFRGKDELIAAAVEHVLSGMVDVLADAVHTDPPPPLAEAVRRIIAATTARMDDDDVDFAALAVQTWAESLRDPGIRDLLAGLYEQVRAQFAELVRRHQAAGTLAPDLDPDAAGAPLFSLLPGFVLQHLLVGGVDPVAYTTAAAHLLRA